MSLVKFGEGAAVSRSCGRHQAFVVHRAQAAGDYDTVVFWDRCVHQISLRCQWTPLVFSSRMLMQGKGHKPSY
jgi:hypothetical protein